MSKSARKSSLASATIGLLAVFFFVISLLGLLLSPKTSAPALPTTTETPSPTETPLPTPTPTQTLRPEVVADLRNCAALLALAQAGVEGAAEQILPTIQDPYLCAQVATPAARLAIPDPNQPPAQEKPPAEAPTPTPNGFDLAQKLGQLGLPDKAFENYATAVAKEPDHPAVESLKNQGWAIWKRLTSLFSFYQPLSGILAVLLLFMLARWAIFAWANNQKYSLDIASFTREGVKFTPEDIDPSNLLAAEMERGLSRLQATGKHSVLGLIDGPLAALDLNIDIAPLPAQVGKLLTFLLKFVPKKQITASGYLSFEPASGAILAVRLIREEPRAKGINATRAFRQADFEPNYQAAGAVPQIEAYLRLAEVATAWIFFEMYRLDHQEESGQKVDQELSEAFGVAQWRSYALNHQAVNFILANQPASARRLLSKARDRDPMYRSALYHLQYLDYMEISSKQQPCDRVKFQEFVQQYTTLEPSLETLVGPTTADCDLIQANAEYLLGSIALYRFICENDLDQRNKLRQSAENHLRLARSGFSKLASDKSDGSPADSTSNREIAYVEISLLTAQALEGLNDEKTRQKICDLENCHSQSPAVLYNLACYYSQLAGEVGFSFSQMTSAQALVKALALLKTAFELDPSTTKFAKGDPQLHSLACGANKAEFDQLLNPPPASPPLSEPRGLIRQEWIERLAEQKIVSREDLLNQGDTYEKRRQLAAKLRIWTDDLTRLVGYADLLQIEGLTPELARLLSLGEYNRVERLKFDPPSVDQIRTELSKQNNIHHLVDTNELTNSKPTTATLRSWLTKAKDTKPRLLL